MKHLVIVLISLMVSFSSFSQTEKVKAWFNSNNNILTNINQSDLLEMEMISIEYLINENENIFETLNTIPHDSKSLEQFKAQLLNNKPNILYSGFFRLKFFTKDDKVFYSIIFYGENINFPVECIYYNINQSN